ncbi:hypothetical protein ACH4S8_36740 [Streptomyces sp. NPDC021080]|uniref:hypothetical protein n=1 Tax=Streptomyces sp. NPDC021080 TaxID=3365110 RepID=UPI0037BC7B59
MIKRVLATVALTCAATILAAGSATAAITETPDDFQVTLDPVARVKVDVGPKRKPTQDDQIAVGPSRNHELLGISGRYSDSVLNLLQGGGDQ